MSRQGKQAARAKPAENVLREGLRLERVPDPAILVLFGATGDLAHRKVLPALYQLWRTNLLPHEFVLVAVGRRPYDDEAFRAEIRDLARAVQPGPAARRDRPGAPFAQRISYHRCDFDDAAGFDALGARLDDHRRRARHARQPAVLPRHPAVAVRRDRRPARPGRARPRAPRRRLAADRHREAVRARPRLGQAPEPRGRQGLPRVAGLPHRPLPRQGDRPQPAGLPLRQRHLRAALEPALRRPRADHGGRVDRHREPRRVLRGDRRVARRPPEPPAPAGQPGRDGAAGDVRGGRPARREGQGPAGHRATPTRPRDVVRGQYGPGWVAATQVAGYREEPEVDPESETETFVAARLTIDDWRWSGVPVLRADRQAPAEAGDGDRHPVPRGPASPVPGRAAWSPTPNLLAIRDPAGRGDHAAVRRQGAGPRAWTSAR